jgi:hypothetical protein
MRPQTTDDEGVTCGCTITSQPYRHWHDQECELPRLVGSRVLVDGCEVIVRQVFLSGSSSYMFPHVKVDFVGGDRNVAVHLKKVSSTEGLTIEIVMPVGNCDGSRLYASDDTAEDGRGPRLSERCPGCRALLMKSPINFYRGKLDPRTGLLRPSTRAASVPKRDKPLKDDDGVICACPIVGRDPDGRKPYLHEHNDTCEVGKDEAGIKAIIALQAVAGIKETREQATQGWKAMSAGEREQTMMAYQVVCGS